MREPLVTPESLAITAAKQGLATLHERPGYAEAMQPPPRRRSSWRGQLAALTAAGGFGVLAYAAGVAIAATWLCVVVVATFALLAVFALLLAIGLTPGKPPELAGVAVLARDEPTRELALLRADGTEQRLSTTDGIFETLRAGDLGVARITDDGTRRVVVHFRRL